MQKNQIRTVLVVVILLLVGLITAILIKRSTSTSGGIVRTPTPLQGEQPRSDNAMARIQRAGAVTAIERGDYKSAIEALSAIVRTGNGVGDEVELLRMAKDLDEKYRKPAEPAPTVVEEPERPMVAKPTSTPPPPRPTPTVVKKPPPPPPRPTVAPRAGHRPAVGHLGAHRPVSRNRRQAQRLHSAAQGARGRPAPGGGLSPR